MKPYRIEKVASTIQDAIVNRLSDPRISRFTSVTRVKVSGDLQLAKVYVSVMGSPGEQRRTMAGLQHAVGHVQTLLAKRLHIRQCPRIQFVLDESIKKAAQTMRLIEQSMAEIRSREPAAQAPEELEAPEELP